MCYLGNIAWRSGRTVEFAQQGIRSAKILGLANRRSDFFRNSGETLAGIIVGSPALPQVRMTLGIDGNVSSILLCAFT
jgi:hypothetical protein